MSDRQTTDDIETVVGPHGTVEPCYGGVRIVVRDPAGFPWREVLERLTESFDEVWLRKQGAILEIMSKSKNP